MVAALARWLQTGAADHADRIGFIAPDVPISPPLKTLHIPALAGRRPSSYYTLGLRSKALELKALDDRIW